MLVGGRPQFARAGAPQLAQAASQGAAAATQSPRQLAAIENEPSNAALGMQADPRVQLERRNRQRLDRLRGLAPGLEPAVAVLETEERRHDPHPFSAVCWMRAFALCSDPPRNPNICAPCSRRSRIEPALDGSRMNSCQVSRGSRLRAGPRDSLGGRQGSRESRAVRSPAADRSASRRRPARRPEPAVPASGPGCCGPARVQCGVAVATGLVRQGTGQLGLADAGRAGRQDRASVPHAQRLGRHVQEARLVEAAEWRKSMSSRQPFCFSLPSVPGSPSKALAPLAKELRRTRSPPCITEPSQSTLRDWTQNSPSKLIR